MSEQSPQANSQDETPQGHEAAMEERILSLLEPEGQPKEEKPKQAESEAQAGDSKEQPEVKAEEEVKPEIPEAEEIEYEGEKFKVAPKLKEAFLRQQDYTKKTQEVAEVRKSYEAALQQATQAVELQKSQYPLLGKLHSLDDQIAQYEKVDWNTLTAQDTTRAQQLFIAFQQAKDARGKTLSELQAMQAQQSEASKQALNARLEEGRKTLEREIKGWGAELGQKLSAFGQKTYGFSAEQVANVTDPKAVKLLHDAYQWHNAQEQAKKLPEKKAQVPTQTLKPTAADTRTPEHQSYMDDRKALKSAKTNKDRTNAAERMILRKLS
jgi:hypothetical protein